MKGTTKKGLSLLSAAVILTTALSGLAVPLLSQSDTVLAATTEDMTAEITKRVEWTDEDTGDGQVTLQYSSTNGEDVTEKSVNLIVIQDKSGSMDSNYAYNLEKIRCGWVDEDDDGVSNELAEIYYPSRNELGYSESITDDIARNPNYATDILKAQNTYPYYENNPYQEYANLLPAAGESFPAFDSRYTQSGASGDLVNGEVYYNSPCTVEGHYYLLINDVSTGNDSFSAYSMASGQLLNSIWDTDKHEYQLLESRDEALVYLSQGRRVVRIEAGTTNAYYPTDSVNSNGDIDYTKTEVTQGDGEEAADGEGLYFLDISSLVLHSPTAYDPDDYPFREGEQILSDAKVDEDGNYIVYGWFLETTPSSECQANDRLHLSQNFAASVINTLVEENKTNQVAYIPFWGDVPVDGEWSNGYVPESKYESATPDANNNYNIELSESDEHFTSYDGVTAIDFTTDYETLIDQINNTFCYDGTNWTRAFQAASDMLDDLDEDETETLVVFLTDGNPQGSIGDDEYDENNGYINGNINSGATDEDGNPIGYAALTAHEGVTVISVGVGTAIGDTYLTQRLNDIDTTNTGAIFARTQKEIEDLADTVLERINETVFSEISGTNAFYADQLVDPFSLDESKLDEDVWAILDTADSQLTYGVPANVYNAVVQDGKSYVYVRSTKTVYWYIGDMTVGSFTAAGHEMTFPICYSDYDVSTQGTDKTLTSNSVQTMTYTTTQDTSTIRSVSTDTPYIIFNRMDDPTLTVTQTITGAVFDEDQTYQFVYSDQAQNVGQTAQGETLTVTISAGDTSGSATATDLEPGTYYIYEVDDDGVILSVQTVTVTRSAEITTEEYSSSVPHSATASDTTQMDNRNNVLTIVSTNGAVSYAKTNVTVEKVWNDSDYSGRPESITVGLLQNGVQIDEITLTKETGWTGIFTNLPVYDSSGSAYEYTVTEGEIVGYQSEVTEPEDQSFVITNTLLYGAIHIQKLDADGTTPLAGVTFELRNSSDEVVDTQTTGEDGQVDFTGLLPDTYTITETATVSGNTLLKDPITVTLPLTLTEQEIEDNNVDSSKYVHYEDADLYLVYDVTYQVTNGSNFNMPTSGGESNPWIYLSLFGGLLILGAAGVILFHRRKAHK